MTADKQEIFQSLMAHFHKAKFDVMTGEELTKQILTDGREVNDPTPVAPPIGYKRQPSMVEIVRAQIRDHALAVALAEQGVETFEEADDFDIGDDYDPSTPYENDFDPPISEVFSEAQRAIQARDNPPPQPPAVDPAPGVAPNTRSQEPASAQPPHSTST